MTEFLSLLPPPEALNKLLAHLEVHPSPETIETEQALGRVNFAALYAPYSLPSFPRSTVDGYAVRARDTHGASESLPAYLSLVGEVPMGASPTFEVAPTACAVIHTGGMLPAGADAVVMVEHTQIARPNEIEILKAVGAGDHVLNAGEDVMAGDVILEKGLGLRPAEIGGLMGLGITNLAVAKRPRVGILSSGDEIMPPGAAIQPGQVHDINTYALQALITESGGQPVPYGIIPDEANAFRLAAEQALRECDIVLFTAGSSVSARDLTATTIEALGQPGVLVHGVSVRPGKPTILAICEGKPVIGLPGNPVSALVIAGLFVRPVIEKYLGYTTVRARPSVAALLGVNLASQAGREDWVAVKLQEGDHKKIAEPIFGKSNLIFTLARADGLIRIPAAANGLAANTPVEVILL